MKLPGEDNEFEYDINRNSAGFPMYFMLFGVCFFILIVFGSIILTNKKPSHTQSDTSELSAFEITDEADNTSNDNSFEYELSDESSTKMGIVSDQERKMKQVEEKYKNNELVASDLDIWDMKGSDNANNRINNTPELTTDTKEGQDTVKISKEDSQIEVEEDPSSDGKHTKVILRTGEEEWVTLDPILSRNYNDDTRFILKNNRMGYYVDDTNTAQVGIKLDSSAADIEFSKIKADNIDFIMARVGYRGYETGELKADEKFNSYMVGAANSQLMAGAYFESQAIDETEIQEEINFVLAELSKVKVTYPVVISMGFGKSEYSRIEKTDASKKTELAKAFCEAIKKAGYVPMLRGNKEWLIKEISLRNLTDYEVWLDNPGDLPDYPYKYSIWEYNKEGEVFGVNRKVPLLIGFENYALR